MDVFFVISGYLITSIILIQKEGGGFSLLNFYERRARRILPPIFLVMAVCIPFAWLWLLPSDMRDFSQSLVAVSLIASNVLFWRESGYFDTAAELKPLLHTWSLAVEEQYYLLFPLFLLVMWRFGKRWTVPMLAVIATLSFGLAQWGAYNKPAATFFLLPTRGWEIAIGALIAFCFARYPRLQLQRPVQEAGGLIGLLLILYAVFAYSKETPFPSAYALVPTLGAALIILCTTPSTLVGRVLTTKAIVGVGLISYSAYLWHQPLFAFARHAGIYESHILIIPSLIALTFFLAAVTRKVLEIPIRNRASVKIKPFVFGAVFLTAFFVVGGLSGHKLDGNIGLLSKDPKYHALLDRMRGNYGLHKDCEGKVNESTKCRTSDVPEVLLWGDSFAMHLAQGFLSSNKNIRMIQTTVSQCAPILGLAPANAIFGANNCIEGNNTVIELLTKYPSIKFVVLGSPSFLQGNSNVIGIDRKSPLSDEEIEFKFIDTLESIVQRGATPIIFSPTPVSGRNIGQCLLRAELKNTSKDICNFQEQISSEKRRKVNEMLARLERKYRVVWLSDGICKGGICYSHIDEFLLYRDEGHFSYEGSAYIGKKMNFYDAITQSP